MPGKSTKRALVSPQCVACGTCIKCCPLGAITVPRGISAEVDSEKCVGCGKCAAACPACVITLEEISSLSDATASGSISEGQVI